ncbi:monocarboxylate transporter 12-B-like [Haliotis rubra]|uniref:monocarboxylate transporter 12-B-like n=1 Tax=Haliotis rubra TaxID=36100 RepID=UPI001EE63124|nr:monocarboxylate transporter 12-B-like [Haliotis rubra]
MTDDSNNAGDEREAMAMEPRKAPDGGHGWVCVAGRFFIVALSAGFTSGFGILYVEIIDYFDTSRAETAWMSSLFGGMNCVGGLFGGAAIQRYGSRTTTVAGSILAGAGFIGCYFSPNIYLLCFAYGILVGTGLALMFVSSSVIVLQYFDKRRGLSMSISSLGEGVGMLVLPPLTNLLIETYSWRGAFLVTAGITLNAAVFGLLFVPPPYVSKASQKRTAKRGVLHSFKQLLQKKLFFLFAFGSFLLHVGYTVPIVHLIDLVVLKGTGKSQSTLLMSVMGITSLVSIVIFGWISDLPKVSRISLHSGCIAVLGASIMVVPSLSKAVHFFIFAGIFGMFNGAWYMGQGVVLSQIVGVELTSVAFGVHSLHTGSGMFLSSLLAGWLFDVTGSYVLPFYTAGCLYLCASLITLIVVIARHRVTESSRPQDSQT